MAGKKTKGLAIDCSRTVLSCCVKTTHPNSEIILKFAILLRDQIYVFVVVGCWVALETGTSLVTFMTSPVQCVKCEDEV